MRQRFIIAMFILISLPGLLLAHDVVWPGKKLAALFPGAAKIIQKNITLSRGQILAIEKKLGVKLRREDAVPSFYIAYKMPEMTAAEHEQMMQTGEKMKIAPYATAWFVDTVTSRGKMEVGVAVDTRGKVLKVVVFEHREDPAIARDEFLNQFIGKGLEDKMRVDEDIKAIKGAEEAARALVLDVRKTLIILDEVFRRKK